MVKVIFHTSLREVPILKREAIEENHCLIQRSPYVVRNFSSVLATPLLTLLGAQWLSVRVLDSRPRGSGFEPHRHHCVVVLEQDTFILA